MLNSAQFIGRRNYINYVNKSKPIDMIIEPSDEDEKIQPVQIKEIATDSFNLKYNKKYYGLHHVAFPGTYQMDLFFSAKNKNCYLLAIEVKVLSHNSYKFNALFKKSTTFCICFQLELHFLLAHKKLLTFSIRSQLLLLFLRYIKK